MRLGSYPPKSSLIIAKDLNGMIIAWNEGARRIYGYDAADVLGKAHSFILHDPEDVQSGQARKILDEVRRLGKWEGELRRVRKGGGRFAAHVTFMLRRKNDELEGQNRRVEEANRLKSEFLELFRKTAAGRRTLVIVWTAKELTTEDRARLRSTAKAVVLKNQGGD